VARPIAGIVTESAYFRIGPHRSDTSKLGFALFDEGGEAFASIVDRHGYVAAGNETRHPACTNTLPRATSVKVSRARPSATDSRIAENSI
jgi:hypothetical protein